MIAIVDYGVGNLFSLNSSFRNIGENAVVTGEPELICKADRIVLPGVGAFGDAARKLREVGLTDILRKEAEKGKPFLGICLGMQLLFEKGYEYGQHDGLGLIPGDVVPIRDVIPIDYKIPHIGWNGLRIRKPDSALMKYTAEGDQVYFVHSFYAANCSEYIVATAEYGAELTAAVQNGNVYGCQFHPEKSGQVGLKILRAFCETETGAC